SESLSLSWPEPDDPDASSTVWLHPSIPVRFTFDVKPDTLDRGWVESIMRAVNLTGAIRVDEHLDPRPRRSNYLPKSD
ncbi:MAG: hypothetical protein WA971_03625, partial [Microbacterium sp.]